MHTRHSRPKYKAVLLYSALFGLLLFLLKWLELRLLIFRNSIEIYIGAIALIFTLLGIWLAMKLTRAPITTIVEEPLFIYPTKEFVLNENALKKSGISARELEVLQLMAAGCSNREIAERLFVSLNTIKTHTSSLYNKLDVQRRTQAVEKGRRLQLVN